VPTTECIVAVQVNGEQPPAGNPHYAGYLVIALVAIVLGLVVLVFIRTSARRSSKG